MSPQAFVVVDGVSLAIRRDGLGAAVVCLSAVGHDSADFDGLAERLNGRCETVRIDWPGHGQSGPDSHPASAARYADLLEGALDALGVTRPVVVGNSIGGAAALILASRRPVAGVVLCDSGGLVPVNAGTRALCALFAGFFRAGASGAAWYDAAFALYYRIVLPAAAAKGRRREIIANGRRLAPILAEAWESFGRPEADLRALAAHLDLPIWVAWARRDWVIPLALCRPAIRTMRDASLSRFDGGHSPFLEDPDAFAAGFSVFLDRVGVSRSPSPGPALSTSRPCPARSPTPTAG